jgi:hypothetical protein
VVHGRLLRRALGAVRRPPRGKGRAARRASGAVRGLRGVAAALGGGRRPAGAGGVLDADARGRPPAPGAPHGPPPAGGDGPRGGGAPAGAGRGAHGGAQGPVAPARDHALHDAAGRSG